MRASLCQNGLTLTKHLANDLYTSSRLPSCIMWLPHCQTRRLSPGRYHLPPLPGWGLWSSLQSRSAVVL
jgi:hypothetical protein